MYAFGKFKKFHRERATIISNMRLPTLTWALVGLSFAVASPLDIVERATDCTDASKSLKKMQLKSWRVWHAVTAKAHLRGDFSITNPATGDSYALKGIPYIDDNEWHACETGSGGALPKQLVGCDYIYDTMNGEFGFRFRWSCAAYVMFCTLFKFGLLAPSDWC